MKALDLCPDLVSDAKSCSKKFCSYRNKKGLCSLDIDLEDKEYEVGIIADILQISRQRVWRLYDAAVSKLQLKLNK